MSRPKKFNSDKEYRESLVTIMFREAGNMEALGDQLYGYDQTRLWEWSRIVREAANYIESVETFEAWDIDGDARD